MAESQTKKQLAQTIEEVRDAMEVSGEQARGACGQAFLASPHLERIAQLERELAAERQWSARVRREALHGSDATLRAAIASPVELRGRG